MSLRRKFKKAKRALRRPFEWLGICTAMAVLCPLPRRALLEAADAASAVMYFFDRAGRRRALANLRIIRGSAAPGSSAPAPDSPASAAETKVIRRSYRNMARTVAHAIWTLRDARRRAALAGEMSPEGKALLAAHRPAVTVSAHLGCWEILSQLAFLEGHEMMSVAKDIGSGGMTRLLMRARRSIGQEIVPAKGAFVPLMKGLKAGKSLGLLVDQAVSPSDGGIWVRFFGRPVPMSAAPAFFAAKCKAPVFVAWSRPLKDGRYRCEVIATHKWEEARDVWGFTQKCVGELEGVIRRHPSCWLLNYNAFRKTPKADDLKKLAEREASAAQSASQAAAQTRTAGEGR